MKPLLFGVLFLTSFHLHSTTYYFSSSSGSDEYTVEQAQNMATPWQTLGKLNAIMNILQPGDQILLKRGDVFSGTILIQTSGALGNPITLGAYGQGTTKPILDSRLKLSNWSYLGNNIWETSSTDLNSQPTALMINEVLKPLGRYPNVDAPNGGYLTFLSDPTEPSKVIIDQTLSDTPNWTGAEAVVRTRRWSLERKLIANHSGTTLTFTSDAAYRLSDNYGYFLQNHPAALDQEGEWCFIDNKILVYSTSDLNMQDVKVANTNNLLDVNNQQNWIIDGFILRGAKTNAFDAIQIQNFTLQNCDFWGSGRNAIRITSTSPESGGNQILNNTFYYTQSNCIMATSGQVMIKGNIIKHTGSVVGMAEGGQMGLAINVGGDAVVEQNTIDSTGYIPIRFEGSNVVIKENVINYFCMVIDDGGGIYTWSNGKSELANRKVINNIILNGLGAPYGTDDPSLSPVEGIYLDDRSADVEVNGNSIGYCNNQGILLHNAYKCIIKNNTVFGCSTAIAMIHDDFAPNYPIVDCVIQNNILVSNSPDVSKILLDFDTRDASLLSRLGDLNHNIYCQPFHKDAFIKYSYGKAATQKPLSLNLSEWQATSGYDANTKLSPIQFSFAKQVLSPNLISNGTFETNTNSWSFWNPVVNSSVMSWVEDQLDSGSISFSVKGSKNLSSRLETLLSRSTDLGKTYLLKMSTKGTTDGHISAYLIQNIPPYPLGSRFYSIPTSPNRRDVEFIVSPTLGLNTPSLFIDIGQEDGTVYLDNIELYEVKTSSPDNYIRFEYNASVNTRTFTADQGYLTPAGLFYPSGSSIAIPPFSSVVLLAKDQSTGIKYPRATVRSALKVFPNPLSNEDLSITLKGYAPQEEVRVAVYDVAGRLVYQKTTKLLNESEVVLKLDSRIFSKGIYLVKTYNHRGIEQVAKFVVN
ncbi:MAG: right-handed parallel beta-helix repeat-containing protein [Haliscomenobacter sp.]|uniref:right-handed parallel beta-helix repeat-containing protein n=1 Tax=Haliscomenobacter sp. TaxID=2717303 RepID=UPI0029AEEBD5|nr:right-handed parallel beta-helix repeat-containing protein [Haliscomenobacter sp.]MDX2068229.1 right-handed parallel beta-helix repeat-containing protein [Haliscomenobacter sp.]